MKVKPIILIAILIGIYACKNESEIDNNNPISEETITTNRWIQDIMEEVYLWEEYIPEGLNPASYDNSYTFFEKFIYEDDYWSWVSDVLRNYRAV